MSLYLEWDAREHEWEKRQSVFFGDKKGGCQTRQVTGWLCSRPENHTGPHEARTSKEWAYALWYTDSSDV